MAIFHFTVTQTKRSKGQSAIASAAYRSGERLYSEYYGEYSDYTRKGGVICADILLPSHAPPEYADRQTLWNAVEKAERGKNAQLASGTEVCPENAAYFVVDQANPGLTNLFITEFQRQMDVREQNALASEESRDPEVVAWERDEITSFTVKVEEVQSPIVTEKPMQSAAAKHKLTPEEKQIKEAVMDTLKARIAHANDGMLATYKSSDQSFRTMMHHKVRIEDNQGTQNGEPLFAIHRRFSSRKTQGCYRELLPKLEYIRQEKAQDTRREKPSIRDQLKAAARSKPEQSTPAKSKKHDMGLE